MILCVALIRCCNQSHSQHHSLHVHMLWYCEQYIISCFRQFVGLALVLHKWKKASKLSLSFFPEGRTVKLFQKYALKWRPLSNRRSSRVSFWTFSVQCFLLLSVSTLLVALYTFPFSFRYCQNFYFSPIEENYRQLRLNKSSQQNLIMSMDIRGSTVTMMYGVLNLISFCETYMVDKRCCDPIWKYVYPFS